jgi:hypothetical protein
MLLPDTCAITADPPIPLDPWSRKGEERPSQHHYRCEAFDGSAAIPVADIAAPDCFLLLWIPLRSVFLVEPLMCAWGFAFSVAAGSPMTLDRRCVWKLANAERRR